MGKAWDKALPDKRIWKECLRVLKHGGFAYVMSAPRQDVLARMMIDLEDVGFKMDFTSMYWAYATGFPKAMNMSKAIDKKLGVEREVVGRNPNSREKCDKTNTIYESGTVGKTDYITKPTSEQAKKLDGSYAGFQPKPAVEVIIVCMKPIEEKGYTDQALANGKGVSWFDDCRIPTGDSDKYDLEQRSISKAHGIQEDDSFLDQIHDADAKHGVQDKGRYPANLLVSDNAVDTGVTTKATGGKVTAGAGFNKVKGFGVNTTKGGETTHPTTETPKDSGDFSRYFDIDKWWESQFIITPKASKSEKNKGCEDFEEKLGGSMNGTQHKSMKTGSGNERNNMLKNHHPTVKPLKLMSYLITLGSREGDIVLDPFMGSGTTPLASKQMGRKYIGIEREEQYFKICCARVGDKPTVLDNVEEKPIEENIEEKPIEEKVVEENTICELCKVDYNGSTKEEHESRKFHQDYV
jgi:site-specific DNA-methyltransferase (adenine-specific)